MKSTIERAIDTPQKKTPKYPIAVLQRFKWTEAYARESNEAYINDNNKSQKLSKLLFYSRTMP